MRYLAVAFVTSACLMCYRMIFLAVLFLAACFGGAKGQDTNTYVQSNYDSFPLGGATGVQDRLPVNVGDSSQGGAQSGANLDGSLRSDQTYRAQFRQNAEAHGGVRQGASYSFSRPLTQEEVLSFFQPAGASFNLGDFLGGIGNGNTRPTFSAPYQPRPGPLSGRLGNQPNVEDLLVAFRLPAGRTDRLRNIGETEAEIIRRLREGRGVPGGGEQQPKPEAPTDVGSTENLRPLLNLGGNGFTEGELANGEIRSPSVVVARK